MTSRIGLALLAAGLLRAAPAAAFPAAIRHSFVNCTACHHSPAGGGLLTPYGRQLSRELLSTWSTDREAAFAYGAVRPPAWLALGAQLRGGLVYGGRRSDFTWDTAEAEAAARLRRFILLGSLGRQIRETPDGSDGWISRRHYVQFEARRELSVRAGRFLPNVGIYQGAAAPLTSAELGSEPGQETYNAEANWVGERWSGSVSAILGGRVRSALAPSRGWAVSANVPLGVRAKVGMTYLRRSQGGGAPHAIGGHALLGLSSRVYFIGHAFVLPRPETESGRGRAGTVHYERFGVEVLRGLSLFAVNEAAYGGAGAQGRRSRSGVGAQWLVRPSLEVQAEALTVRAGDGSRAGQASVTFGLYP